MTDVTASRPEFRSDLAQTPLPEVLATVHHYRVLGMIECSREKETKRLYIDAGSIIFATSNNVADSLGNRLLQQKRITRQQYDESVKRLGEGEKRQGSILVEMRAIDPKDLFIAVREQVQAIAWSIFGWESGAVRFQPGRDKHHEFIKLEIPIQRAILEGVQYGDAKFLLARVGSRSTVVEVNPDAQRSDFQALNEEETALLEQVDGKRNLGELTHVPPRAPLDNARLLYAFHAMRLIRPKAPKQIKVHVRSSRTS
jgi:two-component system, OmpR family, response regulator